MSTTKHTPGPWAVNPVQLNQVATADAAFEVAMATVLHPAEVTIANARRIVACVNACEGVRTEVLEDVNSSERELLHHYVATVDQRDELKSVACNFEIAGPDADGIVWLILHGSGTTGKAMINIGTQDKVAAQVALHLEADRRAAIAKAAGGVS